MPGRIVAVLLSCAGTDTPKDSDTGGPPPLPEVSAWTGTLHYEIALNDPGELLCDLAWTFDGVATEQMCDDCEYGFDLPLTFDPDASLGAEDCLDDLSDADDEWLLGYDRDFDVDTEVMWLYSGGAWQVAFYATLDGDTLSFERSFTYEKFDQTFYYTFDGTGALSP